MMRTGFKDASCKCSTQLSQLIAKESPDIKGVRKNEYTSETK